MKVNFLIFYTNAYIITSLYELHEIILFKVILCASNSIKLFIASVVYFCCFHFIYTYICKCSINIIKQYPGKGKIIHLNINRTFVLTTDDRNDSMYDVSLNVVFLQFRSYDTKTQFCFTDHFGLEDWVSHVKYRKNIYFLLTTGSKMSCR